jgi:hypothetical protein
VRTYSIFLDAATRDLFASVKIEDEKRWQSWATRKSFAAANALRIKTIADNQADLVKAASAAIPEHIANWRKHPGTPIRSLHHQIRLATDQKLPGSLASIEGGE